MRFALSVAVLFLLIPGLARAEERIRSLDVEATIVRGDDFTVSERIGYDFGADIGHVVSRVLPRELVVAGRKIPAGTRVLSVFRDGKPEPFRRGNRGDALLVEMGDPGRAPVGEQAYRLVYQLARTVVATPTGQRLRWDVSTGWPVPVEASTFRLDAPVPPLSATCFTGPDAEAGRACQVSVSGTQLIARIDFPLDVAEGWGIEATYPVGTFVPGAVEAPARFPWLAPWMAFTALFSLFWAVIWLAFGRDPSERGAFLESRQEAPLERKPYEVAALANNGCTHRLLAATVLDLARSGAVRAVPSVDGRGALKRGAPDAPPLDPIEAAVLEIVFANEGDPNLRRQRFARLRERVDGLLKTQGWHRWNVGFVRGAASVAVLGSWIACVLVLAVFYTDPHLPFAVLALFVGFFFAFFMPKRTKQGAVLHARIMAFRRFVRMAGRGEGASRATSTRTPERFHRLLPYAVAIGAEEDFGRWFSGVAVPIDPADAEGATVPAGAFVALARELAGQVRVLEQVSSTL